MKLQFAFGNPRGVTKRKKKVAHRVKKGQTNGSEQAGLHSQSHGGRMRRKKKSRRNPTSVADRLQQTEETYKTAPMGSPEKTAARKRLAQLLKVVKSDDRHKMSPKLKKLWDRAQEVKNGPAPREISDADRVAMGLKPRKKTAAKAGRRKSVAKKKKGRRKAAGRKAAKKAVRRKKRAAPKKVARRKKRAAPKKVSRRRKKRRSLHSHSSKQRHVKKGQKFKVSISSGGRRLSGSVKANPRRKKRRAYPKRRTHKHGGKVHHVKKGSRFKVVAKRKGLKLSGVAIMNPRRRKKSHKARRHHRRHRRHSFGKNPMADAAKYLGMNGQEAAALAAGGALVPIVNSLASTYLGAVVTPINNIVGPMATGSIIPILIGAGLNALAEHAVKTGKGHDILKLAGEGLAAAGLVSLASSFSQQYIKPALGLSGVLYVPGLSGADFGGIKYTPGMSGIRYTPMSGMGVMPQLGAGYTEAHKRSPADFGKGNYWAAGPGMGSGADFGGDGTELSEDADIDEAYDPEDILDSGMG